MALLPPDPVYIMRNPDAGLVSSICFHCNDRLLAGTSTGKAYIWDLQTNRSLTSLDIGRSQVVSLHHETNKLISQEKEGQVKLWILDKLGYKLQYECLTNYYAFCRITVTNDLVIVPKNENDITILSAETFAENITLSLSNTKKNYGYINCFKVVMNNGDAQLLSGYESGHIVAWDIKRGQVVTELFLEDCPLTIDFDPVDCRGVCGGKSEKFTTFTYKNNQLTLNSETVMKSAGINCVKIRNDKKILAIGCWDGRIRLYSWKSLRPLTVLTQHKTSSIMDIAFSVSKVPLWSSPIMAVASVDGHISLWDIYK